MVTYYCSVIQDAKMRQISLQNLPQDLRFHAMQTIVFVPGLLCNERLYEAQTEAVRENHKVFVADATKFDNLGAIADDILHSVSGPFALVGLSMGGYISMELLRRAPGRVTHLLLTNTKHTADTPEETERRRLTIKASQQGMFAGVTRRLLAEMLHPLNVSRMHVTEPITAMAREVGYEAFCRQQTAIMARPDSTATLQQVDCPAVVVCGDADRITPPTIAAEMARLIPGGVFRLVTGSGHLTPLEQPVIFNGILRDLLAC